MHSRLIRWSRGLYLAGMVLALVALIPAVWFPFQLGKTAFFALLLLPVVILFTAGGGVRDLLRAHGLRLALLVGLLPLVYLLSWFFSPTALNGFTGFGVESDTVLFTTIGFVAFLLSFAFFRTLRTVHVLTQTVFWTLIIAVLFQFLVVLVGTGFIPFDFFSDRSVNLIGKWNDLGLFAGLLLLMVTAMLELSPGSTVRKYLFTALLVAVTFLLGVINFSLVWGLILGFSLVIALAKVFGKKVSRANQESAVPQAPVGIPWYALSISVVAITCILFGSTFNTAITSLFPVSSIEVRPAYSSTLDIISASRDGARSLIFGNGPNTFGDAWLTHKPLEVNQTVFWDLDFNVGFSVLLTALGSVGVLGVIAWLMPLWLVLLALVRAIRLGVLSREERIMATFLSVGALFLIAAIVLYVPSQNGILLAFVLSGATFGFLWRQGRSQTEAPAESSRMFGMAASMVALVLMLVSLWAAFTVGRRTIAISWVQAAAVAINAGDYTTAMSRADRARSIETTTETLRASVSVDTAMLQQIANSEVTAETSASVQAQFASLAQETIALGQELVALNDSDYRSYLALARVYELLAALKVNGALESANAAYAAAVEHNPTSPTIPLALARLAASQNDLETTKKYLTDALTLKSNYTDAMLFAVQVSVAENDLPNAINAALAAAQSAPGVAPIWFQLGLLLYTNGDITNSIAALEQAVILVPDYANAKYFLGLAYASADRNQEAIAQFEDIQRTNPDNSEVQIILGNLRLGKEPFEGVEPPPTPPEERAEAPVSE